jgi:hypothetical protein
VICREVSRDASEDDRPKICRPSRQIYRPRSRSLVRGPFGPRARRGLSEAGLGRGECHPRCLAAAGAASCQVNKRNIRNAVQAQLGRKASPTRRSAQAGTRAGPGRGRRLERRRADPRARVAGRDDAQRGASRPTSRCSSCLAACSAHQACLARRRAAPALDWRSPRMKRGSVGAARRTMGIRSFLVSNLGQPPRGRAIIPRASPWPARPTTRARASNRDREQVLFAGHGLHGPHRSWDMAR